MNTEMIFACKLMLFSGSKAFFGPGTAELLQAIDKTGNVKDAAASMGLSYTKAWIMLRNIKEGLGSDAVISMKGGAKGGKAELTEEGRRLLMSYVKFEKESLCLLNESFRRCFNEN